MTVHLAEAWTAVVQSPLLGLGLTLGAYQAARAIWRRTGGHSLANPVPLAIAAVVSVLLVAHIDYDRYLDGAKYVSVLLGPATVSLAVPLRRQVGNILRSALPVAVCTVVGCTSAIVAAIAVTQALGGTDALVASMAPKSATTPIAISLAQTYGGVPALTAVLTVLTGVVGAVAAPAVLTLCGIHDDRVRGFAIGMTSHAIGTSRAFHEGPVVGAYAGLAMAINALATAVALPVMIAFMG